MYGLDNLLQVTTSISKITTILSQSQNLKYIICGFVFSDKLVKCGISNESYSAVLQW